MFRKAAITAAFWSSVFGMPKRKPRLCRQGRETDMEKLLIKDYVDSDDIVVCEATVSRLDSARPIVMLTAYGMGDSATVLLDRAGAYMLRQWLNEWLAATLGTVLPVASAPAQTKLTGTLKGASWCHNHHPSPCLNGYVFGNPKFPDGQEVWTSRVVEHLGGNLFRTQSGSIYAVEWAQGDTGSWPMSLARFDPALGNNEQPPAPPAPDHAAMRREFEEWCARASHRTVTRGGLYVDPLIDLAWAGWQARAALPVVSAPEPNGEHSLADIERRYAIAGAALAGVMARTNIGMVQPDDMAKLTVRYTDALITLLKKGA